MEVVKSRDDQLPTKNDFLAALLPLACIPALLSLCCGMLKWCMTVSSHCPLNLTLSFTEISFLTGFVVLCRKDDCWILSRGVYVFVSIGLLLLFGAISAVIIVVRPWTVSVKLLTQFSMLLPEIYPSDTSFLFQL